MPESLRILVDQNVPLSIARWLGKTKPEWDVEHTSELGLGGASDEEVYARAQETESVILTFDEDFADQRSFPVSEHHGVIRLRVWPTTPEETKHALQRLFDEVPEADLDGSLVVVGRTKIRIRSP
ncbi:hypothetical protein BRD56_10940 [Thermoplasmatales archaeon SW_10_69_26]|nr:MAG: hypothetical protein BRD56_10940 [Thermoplasmatales archaeon SW_10_69_26]